MVDGVAGTARREPGGRTTTDGTQRTTEKGILHSTTLLLLSLSNTVNRIKQTQYSKYETISNKIPLMKDCLWRF